MKKGNQKDTTDLVIKWGILSAFAASLCCVGPLILILLGVGGASTALSIGYRKPYFLIFGLIILVTGFFLAYRTNCRNKHLSQRQQIFVFGGAFVVAVALYYFLTFVLTPLIAPWVYQLHFGG